MCKDSVASFVVCYCAVSLQVLRFEILDICQKMIRYLKDEQTMEILFFRMAKQHKQISSKYMIRSSW